MTHPCEQMVAYVTEDDEDPHPCGKPASIKVDGEYCCPECYDVFYKDEA